PSSSYCARSSAYSRRVARQCRHFVCNRCHMRRSIPRCQQPVKFRDTRGWGHADRLVLNRSDGSFSVYTRSLELVARSLVTLSRVAGVPTITLNDGKTIPQLGFGVFQIPP